VKLLLDEHIAPAVARGLSGLSGGSGLIVAPLRDWQGGAYLEASDEAILQAALAGGWTLVTYDLRTIPLLLKQWGEQGIAHGGVILIDERSIAQNDIGGLIRARARLVGALGGASWQNRIVYLTR
jgi:predicted nuclease of predicted toxin-antitoxin system